MLNNSYLKVITTELLNKQKAQTILNISTVIYLNMNNDM